MYWAARAIHLNHINLVAQAWILAGCSRQKFTRIFPGWMSFAKATAVELATAHRSDKPDWYKRACTELFSIDKDIIYDRSFINWFNSLPCFS